MALGRSTEAVMARRFFYVCAGLFLLGVTYHLGAGRAGAQAGTSEQEVAVLSGQVADGGMIPLPHYADGTEALESECRWIASPEAIQNDGWYLGYLRCSTTGRTVHVYFCNPNACGEPVDCGIIGCPRLSGTANCLIIAVRNTSPTPVQETTLGQLKARYR
jgi:hypothetical protein